MFEYPPILKGSEQQQLSALRDYLVRMARSLEAAREAADAAARLGAKVLSCIPCGEAKHVFTHIEWHMTGYLLELETEAEGLTWETAGLIRGDYSIPTALKAYLKKIR